MMEELYSGAVGMLKELIRVPSFSREEAETARIAVSALRDMGVEEVHTHLNNVWTYNRHFDPAKPTVLLCSHHDTVRPNQGYTRDPFSPDETPDGRLYGLGSNDAGASVVALTAAFIYYYDRRDLKYNLCLAIVGEEEISGQGGVRSILPKIGPLDFAIIGEPTGMNLAIAERGLMVLDCVAHGRSGHAARDEGENAIYLAMKDIEWFRNYRFTRKSKFFSETKMSVTMISAGIQHNVVPAECRFTVDCRVTEMYTNEEVLETIRRNIGSEATPRSMQLRSSSIDPGHPIIRAGVGMGLSTYGSPTTSDMVALVDVPSVKMGPGESARSHSADEFVMLAEIRRGIEIYIELFGKLLQ